MLQRAPGQIYSRVNLAVIAAGGAECKVCFLFKQQHIELISRKLPCYRAAGNAAADDEHIGSVSVKRRVL